MDNMMKAVTFQHPDKIPFSVGMLPIAWLKLGDDLVRFAQDYREFFPYIPDPAHVREEMPPSYRAGTFTDEWGCVWSNVADGMEAIVTGHPVPRREDIRTLQIPQNRDGRLPHGLMYLRLLDLRGFEEAMLDFAEECEELKILIDKVLEYNCIQIDCALPRMGELVYFGDDLGMQNGLAIGPDKWRRYLAPCYEKMFGKIHAAGKKVYMHTDGMIYEIMPDLSRCGADIINPQYRANGLDNLVRVCRKENRIAIDLDLDRQLFPFATPSQLDDHVRECVEALYLPEGGLSVRIELSYEVPLDNMAAILDAARKYRGYRGGR